MKKLNVKTIGLSLLGILILIQFIPTAKNNGEAIGENDISHVVNVPANIQEILKVS